MGTTSGNLIGGASRLNDQLTHSVRWAKLVHAMMWRHQRAVANGYDAAASCYDDWPWQALWRNTEWPQLKSVITNPANVLEVGIGTGAIAKRILDETSSVQRYVGIDISAKMLDQCRQLLGERVTLINEDVSLVDFSTLGEPFDFILSCRMLGHIQTPHNLFARLKSVLSDDGLLVVTDIDPHHGYKATRLPTANGRVEVPTFKHRPQDVIDAAERAGLRLDRFYRKYEDQALADSGSEGPDSLEWKGTPLFNLFVFKQPPAAPV